MCEPRAREIVIDQRGLHRDLRHARPEGDIVRPVLHKERNRVARLQTDAQSPVRKPVRPRLEVGIGDLLPLERDEGPVGMIIDRVLDGVRHRVFRIGIELPDRADDPAKAVDVDPVALEAFEQVHGMRDRLECGTRTIQARH